MSARGNILEQILASRRKDIAAARAGCDLNALRAQAERARESRPRHRLRTALEAEDGPAIIGEFKRASPSLGEIRCGARLEETIAQYEAGGVAAFSILTEPNYFRGSLDDLLAARTLTARPILRKDFTLDEFQIFEAAANGADAILLIAAALDDRELERLTSLAEDELGLDALVEVHDAEEMTRAGRCGARLIGVNNRDLRTFATSIETSIALAASAPSGVTLVSESGISTRRDVERLSACGYRGFLIGEALMRAADAAAFVRALKGSAAV